MRNAGNIGELAVCRYDDDEDGDSGKDFEDDDSGKYW